MLAAITNLRNWSMRISRQRYENEQLFVGRYSVSATASWGSAMVMPMAWTPRAAAPSA